MKLLRGLIFITMFSILYGLEWNVVKISIHLSLTATEMKSFIYMTHIGLEHKKWCLCGLLLTRTSDTKTLVFMGSEGCIFCFSPIADVDNVGDRTWRSEGSEAQFLPSAHPSSFVEDPRSAFWRFRQSFGFWPCTFWYSGILLQFWTLSVSFWTLSAPLSWLVFWSFCPQSKCLNW